MLVSADEWKSRIWRAGEETERRDYRATEAKIQHRLGMTRWFNEWARRNRPDARYGDHDLALTWQWVHVAHAHLDLSPVWRGKKPDRQGPRPLPPVRRLPRRAPAVRTRLRTAQAGVTCQPLRDRRRLRQRVHEPFPPGRSCWSANGCRCSLVSDDGRPRRRNADRR
ncbi:MAG: hypothetical protein V9E94_20400 [Microthrixaceae bacterium]